MMASSFIDWFEMARLPERLAAVEKRTPPVRNYDMSQVPTGILEKLARLDETRPLPPLEEVLTPDELVTFLACKL